MNAAGRHELPDNPKELAKLAFLLGYARLERAGRAKRSTCSPRTACGSIASSTLPSAS